MQRYLPPQFEGVTFLDRSDRQMVLQPLKPKTPNPISCNPTPVPGASAWIRPCRSRESVWHSHVQQVCSSSRCAVCLLWVFPAPVLSHFSSIIRFTFFDQIHTTGIDIKQSPTARAVITIGKDMVFRDYAQGAYRMRGIGKGQCIHLYLVPEVISLVSQTLQSCSAETGGFHCRCVC